MGQCEEALICDFAEYYHIYDYQSLDPNYAAILAGGLREDSRSITAVIGMSDSKTVLLASILDAARILIWQNTRDGQRGANKPQSVLSLFGRQEEKKEGAVESFASADEYHAKRRRLLDGYTDSKRICADNSISQGD